MKVVHAVLLLHGDLAAIKMTGRQLIKADQVSLCWKPTQMRVDVSVHHEQLAVIDVDWYVRSLAGLPKANHLGHQQAEAHFCPVTFYHKYVCLLYTSDAADE